MLYIHRSVFVSLEYSVIKANIFHSNTFCHNVTIQNKLLAVIHETVCTVLCVSSVDSTVRFYSSLEFYLIFSVCFYM